MDVSTLMAKSEPFMRYLVEWQAGLPELALSEAAADPRRVAILSVDVINGFCYTGPLASPRVAGIIAPIVTLFDRAHALGIRNLVLVQEAHEPNAVEFTQYPPHGVRGTDEAEAVPEFRSLPYYEQMTTITKNSIHPALNTRLEEWLRAHPEVDTFIVVGDCTDLCTYQTAMHLRLRANANQLQQRIIVPENCSETFDMPVDTARQLGAVPHDADLLHLIFLYNMRLNGVEVVKRVL